MIFKNKNISGLSLLEALVSTAIIGIGFVAILQMTNYSVQSMHSSGERTKANFLTNIIAEDVISARDTATSSDSNFTEYLLGADDGKPTFESEACKVKDGTASANTGKIYNNTESDAHARKKSKWEAILNSKSYLRCRGTNETRQFQVFKICKSGCSNTNTNIQDLEIYIGRVQINLNDGNKRKYLYFQSDYKLQGVNK
tara:strand:- start:1399 stop:1995 length:597 start_codon:yes stop_codon:yes gene_type:complete